MRELARRARYHLRRALGKELAYPIELHVPTELHGSDYGGWTVASGGLDADTVVLSFGVGGDISFDLSLIEAHGVELHAFDPTPEAAEYVAALDTPPQFHFHPWGIAERDGTASFAAQFEEKGRVRHSHNYSLAHDAREHGGGSLELPVFRYATILDRLGLAQRSIGIVKMDIEGAEYAVLEDLAQHAQKPGQILVEFHHFLGIGTVADTRAALRHLADVGYRTFDADSRCREFSLLLTDSSAGT